MKTSVHLNLDLDKTSLTEWPTMKRKMSFCCQHFSAATAPGFDVVLSLELLIFIGFVKAESFLQAQGAGVLSSLLLWCSSGGRDSTTSERDVSAEVFPPNWNFSVPVGARTVLQPRTLGDSVSNLASAHLSPKMGELSPQRERTPSQGVHQQHLQSTEWGALKFLCCITKTGTGGTSNPRMLPIGKLEKYKRGVFIKLGSSFLGGICSFHGVELLGLCHCTKGFYTHPMFSPVLSDLSACKLNNSCLYNLKITMSKKIMGVSSFHTNWGSLSPSQPAHFQFSVGFFCSLVYSLILDGIKEFLSSKEITSELLHLIQSTKIQCSPSLPMTVTSTLQPWSHLVLFSFKSSDI